jgi:hypothetical protein
VTPFTILFFIVAGLGLLVLASVINSLVSHRSHAALRTLGFYLVIVAVYAAAVVGTMLAMPLEYIPANGTVYDGDWSIQVASLRRIPHDLDENYELDFRLGNRGSRPISGPKDLVAYLLTQDGTRYDVVSKLTTTPAFDVTVNPRRPVTVTRTYILPSNLNRIELVLQKTGFRLSWFVIGRSPLDGHTVIVLQN